MTEPTTPPAGPVTAEPLTAEEEAKFRGTVAYIGDDSETGGDWWSNHSAMRLLATIDRERSAREAIRREVSALRVALDDLLDDTEHIDHDCGDTDCPVSRARAVLAAIHAPDTPAGAAREPQSTTVWPRWECSWCRGNAIQCAHLDPCCPKCNHDPRTEAGAAPESREETPTDGVMKRMIEIAADPDRGMAP